MSALGIILIIIVALVVLVVITGYFIGRYFFKFAMVPGNMKGGISGADKSSSKKNPLIVVGDRMDNWFNEHITETITQKSFDGLNLYADLLENTAGTDKFVIICHGYTGKACEMGFQAHKFYEQGYSVLGPSARAHGKSEGSYIGMGWYERKDVCGWIDILNKRFNNPQIVLYGISMGGATVMNVAGEELPANVKCIIEDCGYSSTMDQFRHTMEKMMKIPAFPILNFATIYTYFKTGMNLHKDAIPAKQLTKSKVPVFFAHGGNDRFVPYWMLDVNYNAHPGPKEKFTVPEATHAGCSWVAEEEYWSKVFAFIDRFVGA